MKFNVRKKPVLLLGLMLGLGLLAAPMIAGWAGPPSQSRGWHLPQRSKCCSKVTCATYKARRSTPTGTPPGARQRRLTGSIRLPPC